MNKRNSVIDGLRFIAILSIMLFHYFSRYVDGIEESMFRLPYGDSFDLFSWGHYGNSLFFLISGFLILPSLKRYRTIKEFFCHKLIRLFPPLVISSLLIYIVFVFLDPDGIIESASDWGNLVVSCTMISPDILNTIFGTCFSSVNGGYWFLWVIVEFYVVAGVLYYIFRDGFSLGFTLFTICILLFLNAGPLLGSIHLFNEYQDVLDLFGPFLKNCGTLWMGFYLFGVFQRELPKKAVLLYGALFIYILIFVDIWVKVIVVYFMLCQVFVAEKGNTPSSELMNEVGRSSYFLYLVHEPIGIFAIY